MSSSSVGLVDNDARTAIHADSLVSFVLKLVSAGTNLIVVSLHVESPMLNYHHLDVEFDNEHYAPLA